MAIDTELATLRDQVLGFTKLLEEWASKYEGEGAEQPTPEDVERCEKLIADRDEAKARIKTIELCSKAKEFVRSEESGRKESHTGRWVRSKSEPTARDRNNAFRAWLLGGVFDVEIKDSWKRSADLLDVNTAVNYWIVRDQTSDVDAEGKYGCNDSLHQALVEARAKIGGLESVCEIVPGDVGTPIHYSLSDDTANVAANSAQASDVSNVDLVMDRKDVTVSTNKTAVFPVALELFDDAQFDVGAYIGKAIGKRLARKAAASIITAVKTDIAKTITGLSNNLNLDDLRDLLEVVDLDYHTNAHWVMNYATYNHLFFDLVDGEQRPLVWSSGNSLKDGQEWKLLGYPVVIDNGMDSMSSGQDRLPMFFGDPSFIKRRKIGSGPVIIKDTSRYIDKLSVGVFGYERMGVAYVNPGNDPMHALRTGTLSGD